MVWNMAPLPFRAVLPSLGLLVLLTTQRTSATPSGELAVELERIRVARGVPALAAGIVRSNTVLAIAATGFRKQGIDVPATTSDLWHVGSLTKSMTATALAVLVAEGRLRWDSTLGEVFPETAPRMHPEWRTVTLAQLLRHRGGAPDQEWLQREGLWSKIWEHPGTPLRQRVDWMESVVTRPPATQPGSRYVYSNTGYVLAGRMLEQVSGEAWEAWIRRRVFLPLGMESAGFGVPARPRYIDQPWGHRWKAGVPEPVPPGTDADNPSGLGPAGTVHLTLGDLLRYGAFHADAGRRLAEGTPGAGRVLGPSDFQALHEAPEGESDAFGWRVVRRDWGGGTVLTHTGSNTQWFAVLWVAPALDVAIAAVTNIGDDDGRSASKVTDEAAAWLVRRHLVPRP
jgi:CubicO group peptidase (beta-lactamase class C family)